MAIFFSETWKTGKMSIFQMSLIHHNWTLNTKFEEIKKVSLSLTHKPVGNTGQNWGWSPSLGFVSLGSQTPKLRKHIKKIKELKPIKKTEKERQRS